MTVGSDNPFPSLLIQEAASDGSDFGNPVTDYRRLFLGEDGLLHLRDSAGTVTDIGGSHPNLATHDALGLATDAELAAHTGDTTDAHDASAISVLDTAANFTGTDVEAALAELAASGGGGGPGTELDYVEITSSVNASATTEATANTVVTGSAVTYDGSTAVIIEFFSATVSSAVVTGAAVQVWLYDGSGSIGEIAFVSQSATNGAVYGAVLARRRLTPSAAAHTYSIRASNINGTGVVGAGTGGSGTISPAYIRITRV